MPSLQIPIAHLESTLNKNSGHHSQTILKNEIKGISVEHFTIGKGKELIDAAKEGCKTIYLFIKGSGDAVANDATYEIVPETILLPNTSNSVQINSAINESLHYLKISCKQSNEDIENIEDFPIENTQNVYCKKFTDCQSYSEPIKSPNTISRTILPNQYIPRIAMGTVQTIGPDEVGAHKHPMLEQLFLGLSDNNCTVYADDAQVNFPQHSLLHIPLGSRHSVSVQKDKVMYYVWMDFFLNIEGEEWLKTHEEDKENR